MIKIAITGGLASGKSFVLNIFDNNGFFTLKADNIAKKLYFTNKSLRKSLTDNFGTDFFLNKETLNKQKLEHILYNNKRKRKLFYDIFYPIFKTYQKNYFKQLKNKHMIIVYESALIFQVETYKLFNKIILTHCSRKTQIKRAKNRKLKIKKVKKIINSQPDFKKLKNKADYIINTDNTKKETIVQTNKIIAELDLP